ncbi:hypothetical protein C0992_000419, partial [Termitomyces sp. T32_za158]
MRVNQRLWRRIPIVPVFLLAALLLFLIESPNSDDVDRFITQCASISTPAGPGPSYDPATRVSTGSERHVVGTPPTLIRNAKIWTGLGNGTEIIHGDILLDKGVIISIGSVSSDMLVQARDARHAKAVDIFDAEGSADGNSKKGPVLPWLRSIDALNTHDDSYALAIAGGVTTVQVLPGSANNIGGQSFLIKLRPTEERSATSKVLEPPQSHACGENPSRVYSQSRMDSAWKFREAYESARKLKVAQDAFCSRVEAISRSRQRDWPWHARWFAQSGLADLGEFPQDLRWEALVDVLRGRVKVWWCQFLWIPVGVANIVLILGQLSVHCYEAVDLDAIVRLSNEFKFPIASIHHAGQTYLVPELLKKTWVRRSTGAAICSDLSKGGVPSIALFASNARKKREAYRNSEFAPKILADYGIPVVMKSDHPVLNSRYLMYEAQQAHYYGLDKNTALFAVTSAPAKAAGVGHRVGSLGVGYDADVVIWDSHPLALGATPVQVYIDGIAQIVKPEVLVKSDELQDVPKTPDWEAEAKSVVEHEGLPLLRGRKIRLAELAGESSRRGVKFVGVKNAWVQDDDGDVRVLFDGDEDGHAGLNTTADSMNTVLVLDGTRVILCTNANFELCSDDKVQEIVDLQGGSLAPGLTTFGTHLGLVEILLEPSTSDGDVIDPLVASRTGSELGLVGGDESVIRAVDGLQFEGRNTLLAYRSGVTRAISAPISNGFLAGLSTAFDTGASNGLAKGAVVKEEAALHVALNQLLRVSVSTQIAALRRLLYHSTSDAWKRVQIGEIPLVVNVDSADIMSTLLRLKSDYEAWSGNRIRLTFTGAAEAHLLADKIGGAGVSVVITSARPYPGSWQERRILPGPPLSRDSILTALFAKNVNVTIGVRDEFDARNARFSLAWAALESNGTISKTQALRIATTNMDRALGVGRVRDIVAYQGGTMFDFESRVVGVISAERGTDEAYTTSVKLQRCSLDTANAHNRATYLERENEVLRNELAILRSHPHPDVSPQAHPAVEQVQQLTLSLRRLSDKLSLTEAALLERTTQLSHVAADASNAKMTAEAAYELAARTRGREEMGKLRELELEHKVKAAEEAVKMSDLVVKEYADLVRSLGADKSHERLVDGLAEGKLGLQKLLKDFNAETTRLQKELLEAQGALAVADSHRDSEKRHLEQCRVELAQAQFELQQLKLDDNTAAKMVSRYMKFSQRSTDTLSSALSSLKIRHSATTSTLSTQLLSLRSQLNASTTETDTLRRALDELGGELAKEAFGRRREVALRIRMVNREEKVHGELERWVLKTEEAQERARVAGRVGEGDESLVHLVGVVRKVLEGTFGGEYGEVGRVAVAEAAARELVMELETEMRRRLELERIVALANAAAVDVATDDDHVGKASEELEKQPQATLVQDFTSNSTPVPAITLTPERPLNTVVAVKPSQIPISEKLRP